ncbi:MAG: M3 family metallopeptidase [Alphaproteobacteria bacterium]|nr:M3 family metallopeptidase [Alphaproteobacteria bacterium]
MSNNPLLEKSSHPFEAPAFDKIKEEHYLPAVKEAIEEAKANIQAIKDNPDAPDFDNTIVALELSSEKLDTAAGIFHNQFTAAGTDGLMELMKKIPPLVSAFKNEMSQDEELFVRIRSVYDQKDTLNLTPEQQTVLEDTYKGFVRGGTLLDDKAKARFKEISEELSKLYPTFANNVTKSAESFELIIEDEKDLSGLPKTAITGAKDMAEAKGYSGKWLFTLDYPSYIPFMTYADNRILREKMWRAFGNRAYEAPAKNWLTQIWRAIANATFRTSYDNSKNILKIVALRDEKAKLLGFKNHAEFVLSERMAKTPEGVWDFLEKLRSNYKPAAEQELEALKKFAYENGGPEELMPWDTAYYGEKQKEALFGFSSEELRPYFPLEQTLDGVFTHFTKLFGLEFKEVENVPAWHKDVKTFEVIEQKSGDSIGLLYGDFFPRTGKKQGAWKTSYRDQGFTSDGMKKPIISIVCNFTKPAGDKPALLSFDEVTTLLHEMGHAVHALCSDVTYSSHSGTSVKWDFVELPSQLQENWAYKKETLDSFAAHYETGEKIPAELIEKLNKAKNFGIGMFGLRQVGLGTIDMSWHTVDPAKITDVAGFEEEITRNTRLFEPMGGPTSSAFSHIFAGGYSAGYYSYKWAEVLEADAFEAFEEMGLYDPQTAQSYKDNVLSKGGSEDPSVLYRNFRGRDADPNSLLRREGLSADNNQNSLANNTSELKCQMN